MNNKNQKNGTFWNKFFAMFSFFTMIAKSGEIPTGTVAYFNLTACPDGWVRFTKADGRFIMGVGEYENMIYKLGDSGGEVNHTLTIDEIPFHNHMTPAGYLKYVGAGNGQLNAYTQGVNDFDYGSSESLGAFKSHNNIPPYYALTACYKIFNSNETIGIRTDNPNSDYALDVNGRIFAESLIINDHIDANNTVTVRGNITTDTVCTRNQTKCVSTADIITTQDFSSQVTVDSLNVAKNANINGNITAQTLCALNQTQCVSINDLASKQDCQHSSDVPWTTYLFGVLSGVSSIVSIISLGCIYKLQKQLNNQRLISIQNRRPNANNNDLSISGNVNSFMGRNSGNNRSISLQQNDLNVPLLPNTKNQGIS